jgi:hypothetical protein
LGIEGHLQKTIKFFYNCRRVISDGKKKSKPSVQRAGGASLATIEWRRYDYFDKFKNCTTFSDFFVIFGKNRQKNGSKVDYRPVLQAQKARFLPAFLDTRSFHSVATHSLLRTRAL